MSGYKPGYSEVRSPLWALGYEDGNADADRAEKNGPDPDNAWSAMYMRGYSAGLGN